MNSNDRNENNDVRLELKYCEHCGGLWVRERGAGVVYCEQCQPKVADLPIPKKRPSRVMLPVQEQTLVRSHGIGIAETSPDLEAVGGVA